VPLRIGNNEVNVLAIGSTPVRGAAVGDNIIYTLQTPDNLGVVISSTQGTGRTRTSNFTISDADGFTVEPTGTITVRNAADTNDIGGGATAILFSGSGNARTARLPGRRAMQRYRVDITYSDSNGAHQIRAITTSGSFSDTFTYEIRT